MAQEEQMPTPHDTDEFPSELQKWHFDHGETDRSPAAIMLLRPEPEVAEPEVARFRDTDAMSLFAATAKPSRPWFALSLALLFGTVAGFVTGYTAAERRGAPGVTATEVTDLADEPAPPPLALPSPAVSSPPAPVVVEHRTQAVSRAPVGLKGSLEIVSRPSGAQVRLDGRVVGRTPLSIADVDKGTHVVGIELGGYNRWAAAVVITPDNRTRVGASLEPSVSQAGSL